MTGLESVSRNQTPSTLGPPEKKKNQARAITATSPATAAPICACLLNFFGLGTGCKVFADGCGWTSARHNLEETFDVLDTIYNIKDLEDNIMKNLL